MSFNIDPRWKEQYDEQKKYDVWHFFFTLKIYFASLCFVGLFYLAIFIYANLQAEFCEKNKQNPFQGGVYGTDMGPLRLKS